MTKAPAKTVRDSKSGKSVAGKVLGTTRDGVRILKPRGNATHFTQKNCARRLLACAPVSKVDERPRRLHQLPLFAGLQPAFSSDRLRRHPLGLHPALRSRKR